MLDLILLVVCLFLLAFIKSTIGYFKHKAKAKKEWKRYLDNKDSTWFCTVCHTTQSNYQSSCYKGHNKESYRFKELSEIFEWKCSRCGHINTMSQANCDKCGLRQNKSYSN